MSKFMVHFVFHPQCEISRELANSLSKDINGGVSIFSSRIPTVILPESDDDLPPEHYDLNEAEVSAVVFLASRKMVIEPRWKKFAGDVWRQCENSNHRFLPIQVHNEAWPLDQRLSGVNFFNPHEDSVKQRNSKSLRWLVIELCRLLKGLERGEKLPLRIFLSHAKQDLKIKPKVFKDLDEHLHSTQPVEKWIDSAKIDAGSQFADAIEQGVKDSVLLIIGTSNYSSRPWCRRELLLAKKHQRPFVIIDALKEEERRSFPYGGNAPRLRWKKGAAEQAVNLLLRETLRHYHAKLCLEAVGAAGDVILASPPELATVVPLPDNSCVLYPDPPLGDEEIESFKPLPVTIETPLQRIAQSRTLENKRVILSLSHSSDSKKYGMPMEHLEPAMIDISLQLLARGASLQYGGHLGPDSYTATLFDMVKAYSQQSGLPHAERIINDVGWPVVLTEKDRAKYDGEATFNRIGRPEGVEELNTALFVEEPKEFLEIDTPEIRFAWARGMTAMRESQLVSDEVLARIVLGGPIDDTATGKWYLGRIPGVIEEIYLSLKAQQPVLLLGMFGGASALAIDLLEKRERKDFSWDHQQHAPHTAGMKKIYLKKNIEWEGYEEMTNYFSDWGVEYLSQLNKLSIAENTELFITRDVYRAIELILMSLQRITAH